MITYTVTVDDDGTTRRYLNGELRHENGPAVEYANGRKYWYLNGEELTEKEFKPRAESCDDLIVEFKGKQYRLDEVKH